MKKRAKLALVLGGIAAALAAVTTLVLAWSWHGSPLSGGTKEPAIPNGLATPPDWLVESAPFDVAKHFELPPPEQNAAPLYLDALYEFSASVEGCFSKAEQARRSPIAEERNKRISPFFERSDAPLSSEKMEDLRAALREFDTGFRKLKLAQERPACVFVIASDVGALVPHALAIRNVSRVADLQIECDLEDEQYGRAIELIEIMLRLSRDLQRRSESLCQLVCVATDNRVFSFAVPRLLSSPRVNKEHCNRLLSIINQHENTSRDVAIEAARSEYVLQRLTLEQLTSSVGRRKLKRSLGAKDDSLSEIWAAMYKNLTGDDLPQHVDRKQIQLKLQLLDSAAEIAVFDNVYESMVEASTKPFAERMAAYREVTRSTEAKGIILARLLAIGPIPPQNAYVRHRALMSGTIGLIALRRWQLTQDELPHDLAQVVQDAGMKTVPLDPYGQGEIKMTTLDDDCVLYSIGPDGKDDGARVEWNGMPDQPGDYVFRMKPK